MPGASRRRGRRNRAHFRRDGVNNPAEIGTLILEFGTLSRHTGNTAFFEHSLKLWEGLEQDFNFNAMVSQRGLLNLYHSDAQRDAYKQAREWIDASIELMKPGVTTDQVAKVWPKAEEFGFPNEMAAFGLQFGHGLGLALHEREADGHGLDLERLQDGGGSFAPFGRFALTFANSFPGFCGRFFNSRQGFFPRGEVPEVSAFDFASFHLLLGATMEVRPTGIGLPRLREPRSQD